MMGSSKVMFVVYIRTSYLTKHSYNFFEEYKLLSKTNIMKKVSDEKKVFRSEIMVRKEVNDEIKEVFLLLKTRFKVPLKNVSIRSKKEKSYWLHADGLKLLLTMNPMEKLKITMNKTSENMTYLIHKKKFLCHVF